MHENKIGAIIERSRAHSPAFTLAAIGRGVGRTEKTVWKWKVGKTVPSRRDAERLAIYLGVKIADLGLEDG